MHRYWIEFDITGYAAPPLEAMMGFGVTSHTQDGALGLLQQHIFGGRELPPLRGVIEDVDVSTLDPRHVRPNMGNPVWPGIWFPLGFQ